MAALQFPQFLGRYDIKLFFSSVDDTIPGGIIDKNKRGFLPVGHLSDYVDFPKSKWKTEMKEANFVYGNIERQLSLKGKASLNQFGVSIGGGLGMAKSVKFNIEEVKARGFVKPMRLLLIPEVHAIKKKSRKTWKLINGKCVVDYCYYATKVTFDFEREGNFDIQAEIANVIEVGGDATVDWKSKKSFVVTNNDNVPFGFSGWTI